MGSTNISAKIYYLHSGKNHRGFDPPIRVTPFSLSPFKFQTEMYWSDELNVTVVENVTVARASQTALRSNPVYTQVTMIIIQGRRKVVISHENHA